MLMPLDKKNWEFVGRSEHTAHSSRRFMHAGLSGLLNCVRR
jgi:hypothetical protein